MSTDANSASSSVQAAEGQRARLLPSHRKLRHLQGITLRNLSLSPLTQRHRGKTIDDEALPNALKSPAKLLATSERNKLAQSRSFTDLKSETKSIASERSNISETITSGPAPQTTKPRQPRRTSTLDWASFSPGQRQESLRNVILRRTANVFFTLHCKDLKDPVFISETIESSSNPNFRFFDLKTLSAALTRQDNIVVNFWAYTKSDSSWHHLLELSVHFRHLQFIGQSLEEFQQPLPDNCVIFHLQDGLYTFLSEMPVRKPTDAVVRSNDTKPSGSSQVTSSYDALMRLATLDECIQEAITTREKLTSDINKMIAQDKQRFFASDVISTAQDSLSNVSRAKETEQRQIKSLNARLSELRSNLSIRRKSIQTSASKQTNIISYQESHTTELDTLLASCSAIQAPIRGQRRRICTDVSSIYPIDPIPNKSLLFTIRSLPLPNANFSKSEVSSNGDAISAALGHTAHVVHLLSHYLSIALPYPISPCSSTSTITDPISLSLAPVFSSTAAEPNRIFPLHLAKSTPFYRFEYAVFLLNKDIELMASKLGLRIMDIRQTLPNLKYVLFVATAGEGELPGRKAGGVRGLLGASGSGRGEKDDVPDSPDTGSIEGSTREVDIADTLRKRLVNGRDTQNEIGNGELAMGSRHSAVGKGRAAASR